MVVVGGGAPPSPPLLHSSPWGEKEEEVIRCLVEARVMAVVREWEGREEGLLLRVRRMEEVCRSLAAMRMGEKRRREEDLFRVTEGFREELRQVR